MRHISALAFTAWCATLAYCLLPAARPDESLPVPPADWAIDVVASAPKVSHPSVVTVAPDGRVFVAEDPMDISAPAAHLTLGRILCLHPDGRTTIFADKLYAVFGMQYLDGRLYVLHNPKFSVFEDDHGVGRNRVDLIESTNPAPWALDWNDHVPANFRLGMDGYFYVAVGDKGLYECVGTDGRRVDLHGGGVVRLRPDGSGLEIFSTGVRNILDVAITSDDELFTYDNTDEQRWMSRLTHMVDGGFYGYPYDFIPQRPYTLWMMADYGSGAATGAFAYTEDALPNDYRDNLFLADFGKRQILRVRIAREGGSFRVDEREDLFSDVPAEFRPVGIALDHEGRSIYICDWQHRDTKDKVQVGRLLKLTYSGTIHSNPKPAWHMPAAMGRPFQATEEELISGLSHSSRQVRLVAQRRIAERGAAAIPLLNALLADSNAAPVARWHALWALGAIDGGTQSRAAIIRAAADAEASVARQALRQLGTRRVRESLSVVTKRLRDDDASLRFAAATAAGRIADPAAIAELINALGEPEMFVRYAVFTALNRIGKTNPDAWGAIVRGLESDDPAIREGAALGLRETFDQSLVSALVKLAEHQQKPIEAREAAILLLAEMHRQYPVWKGEWWAYHPVNSPRPQQSQPWAGTQAIAACLDALLADPNSPVRLAAITSVEKTRDPKVAARLQRQLQSEDDDRVRQQIVYALGILRDKESSHVIADLIGNTMTSVQLRRAAIGAATQIGTPILTESIERLVASEADRDSLLHGIRALGVIGRAESVPCLERLTQHDADIVRQVAAEALAGIPEASVETALVSLLHDQSAGVRRSVIEAIGRRRFSAAVPALINAYEHAETRNEAAAAIALIPDPRACPIYLDLLAGKNPLLREQALQSMKTVADQLLPALEQQANRLSPAVLQQLREMYANHAVARQGALFATAARGLGPDDYERFARDNAGSPQRGARLFADEKGLACSKCHTNAHVRADRPMIGPDLTMVGKQFSRAAIIESILYPSKAIREGYQQMVIATEDGRVISGLIRSENDSSVALVDRETREHVIPKDQISERRLSSSSMMPDNQHVGLSLEEFADLVAFLESCRDAP
jgi:putative heme-binding domain-containing protein